MSVPIADVPKMLTLYTGQFRSDKGDGVSGRTSGGRDVAETCRTVSVDQDLSISCRKSARLKIFLMVRCLTVLICAAPSSGG